MTEQWQLVLVAAVLFLLAKGVRKLMSGQDDLNTAVGNLETSATNVLSAISALKASGNDAAAEALAVRINNVVTELNQAIAPPAGT